MVKISPSILSADFGYLVKEIRKVEEAGCEMLHVDVMDGHFVPNISFAIPVIEAIKKHTDMPMDVHLMISNAEQMIDRFIELEPYNITVHAEAVTHMDRLINHIKQHDIKASIALNPATPLNVLDYTLNNLDMVLIMTVNPGFGGQSFIPNMYQKISDLSQTIRQRRLNTLIQVDGGINESNIKKVVDSGAQVIVAGSAVFNSDDIKKTVNRLKLIEG
ncbi:MAG: ribulose-phosphate 3-epimerase [Clostridia bacterium]|nr:ribulose-phosphate 3-epimerase [Clostridia bacterium]